MSDKIFLKLLLITVTAFSNFRTRTNYYTSYSYYVSLNVLNHRVCTMSDNFFSSTGHQYQFWLCCGPWRYLFFEIWRYQSGKGRGEILQRNSRHSWMVGLQTWQNHSFFWQFSTTLRVGHCLDQKRSGLHMPSESRRYARF